MLKQRIITAVIVAVLLLSVLFNLRPQWLSMVFGGVVLLAFSEWSRLSGLTAHWQRALYLATSLLLMIACYRWQVLPRSPALPWRDLLVGAGAFWALALLWVLSYPQSRIVWGSRLVRCAMGIVVLMSAWLSLDWIRDQDSGRWLVLYMILLVAANDIAAYFAGRAFGRRKLLVEVSPGKTWAGFFGGLAGALLVGLVVGLAIGLPVDRLKAWLVVALVTALAAVLGDLLESMIKRESGVKDSGALLPGHGGVLDRIDAVAAAAPLFALAMLATGSP